MQRRVLQTKHLAMTVDELMSVLATVPGNTQIHLAKRDITNLFAVHLEPGRYGRRPGQVVLSSLAEDDPDEEEDAA